MQTISFRDNLLVNMTSSEERLCKELMGDKETTDRFSVQHRVGKYILDFYFPCQNFAVEIDGDIHKRPDVKNKDMIRDNWLRSKGIRVIRFSNDTVWNNIGSIKATIIRGLAGRFDKPRSTKAGNKRFIDMHANTNIEKHDRSFYEDKMRKQYEDMIRQRNKEKKLRKKGL